MKKLKLKALDLGANEILSRFQLKSILGGTGSGSGTGAGVPCTATAECSPGGRTVSCSGIDHCTARDGVMATCDRDGFGNPYSVHC